MLGSVVGVIGTLQATEVLKEILGIGDSLAGRLLIYDALAARFETMRYAWDPDNPLIGHEADHPRSVDPRRRGRMPPPAPASRGHGHDRRRQPPRARSKRASLPRRSCR